MRKLGFVLIILVCYCAGAASYKYKVFPVQPFRLVRDLIAGKPLDRFLVDTTIKPRNSVFEAFHPHADIVMIGDSNTQGAEWREVFPEFSIANRGIGGDRSDDILRRISTVLELNPKKAFLMFGFNDFAIGQGEPRVFANYKKIVEQLEASHVQVYIQSTLECSRNACQEILENIRELNSDLASYAKEKGIPFVNINRTMTSEKDGLLKPYTYDGAHLLGSGYVEWRAALEPYLAAVSR